MVEHDLGKIEKLGSIPTWSLKICPYSLVAKQLFRKHQTTVRFRIRAYKRLW